MKRLTLEAFKVKKLKENQQQPVDQLLGQVLGECHDSIKHKYNEANAKINNGVKI